MSRLQIRISDGARFLKIGAAATALGVSPATIRRWCDTGQLACIQRETGHRLISLDSVNELRGRTLSRLLSAAELKRGASEPRAADRRSTNRRVVGAAIGPEGIYCACLERLTNSFRIVGHRLISCRTGETFPALLLSMHEAVSKQLARWRPTSVALLQLFPRSPSREMTRLGDFHGMIMLAATRGDIAVREYTYAELRHVTRRYRELLSGLSQKSNAEALTHDALGAALAELLGRRGASANLDTTPTKSRQLGRTPDVSERAPARRA